MPVKITGSEGLEAETYEGQGSSGSPVGKPGGETDKT